MLTGGEERKVKLRAAAVSKTTREDPFVWILTILGAPLNVKLDMERGFF